LVVVLQGDLEEQDPSGTFCRKKNIFQYYGYNLSIKSLEPP
jgi:hypothetical protein